MEDFIELGIEGVDKVVDKHFDKIPDKYLHKGTYSPRKLTGSFHRKDKKNHKMRERSPDPDLAYGADHRARETRHEPISMRDNEASPRNINDPYPDYGNERVPNYSPNYSFSEPHTQPVYSQAPPRQRPQYTPPYYPEQAPAPSPPYQEYPPAFDDHRARSVEQGRRRRDSFSDDDYDLDRHARRPERPSASVRRRSSSYHGPSSRSNEIARATKHPESSLGGVKQKAKDKASRYGLKDEVDIFSSSTVGLAGGAVGALVGGLAAREAQKATGQDKNGDKAVNGLLTFLGAAAGGLAVNVVVDRWEESKKDADVKLDKRERKFESGRGERDRRDRSLDRSRRGGRRSSYSDEEYYR
ncbi:hypothetical protein HYFRA_00007853 [Hymenoscyphus fraxineus]|uniref:Uncharacterized protein n=1 Tax=Hymenoscyphus fraxineus TaxID=746836 RepID=A0A9N9KP94_9HELO|nr:hypothetical protein HYFRA_00007853 [Hymenoscyphus fraxineus]